MKNKNVLLLLILFFCGINTFFAQNSQEKYGFGYSRDHKSKVLYVSNLVKALDNTEVFYELSSTDLHNQWVDLIKTKCDKEVYGRVFSSGTDIFGWFDYESVYKRRIQYIGEHKQEGFKIIYIDNFFYIQRHR
jgi:hypothetical protein